ncbi:hypothetical protein F5Y19DRAFT_487596 [Xylariaceae sp. FL1651]|nr:hypothetical protein F5Y19DRAFT_487596 [Xylariaceae sp. FL1651]
MPSLLFELTAEQPRTTTAINGLDECNQKTRRVLLEALTRVTTSGSPTLIKVFIASREDDDTKDEYEGGENSRTQASNNQGDIENTSLLK